MRKGQPVPFPTKPLYQSKIESILPRINCRKMTCARMNAAAPNAKGIREKTFLYLTLAQIASPIGTPKLINKETHMKSMDNVLTVGVAAVMINTPLYTNVASICYPHHSINHVCLKSHIHPLNCRRNSSTAPRFGMEGCAPALLAVPTKPSDLAFPGSTGSRESPAILLSLFHHIDSSSICEEEKWP